MKRQRRAASLVFLALASFFLLGQSSPTTTKAQEPAKKTDTKNTDKKGATPSAAANSQEPLNYLTLSHTISITSLRAGSHDDSGRNQYYFLVNMHALLNTSDERNLPFEKKKKMTVEIGKFGDTTIDSLAFWVADSKNNETKEIAVDGNTIRELAAQVMREFKIPEADFSIMIEIIMFKKQKKYLILGDDLKLTAITYYTIPPTKFDAQMRVDQNLLLSDEQGTHVKIAVHYNNKQNS